MNHPNTSLWESFFQLLDAYTSDDFLSAENEDKIIAEIVNAGFKKDEAQTIFYWMKDLKRWMDGLNQSKKSTFQTTHPSMRVYTPEENAAFSPEARACLKNLEEAQVIDADLREQIIEQAMNLFDGVIGVPDLKWVVFPLLFRGAHRISSEKQLLAILMLSSDKTTKH